MADLTRDRGQIILLAAFALALTFVALALVINSAIFSENLATRGGTSGSGDALQARHEVEINVGQVIESANLHNTSTQTDLEEAVEKGTLNVSIQMERQRARTGTLINVTVRSSVDSPIFGSRVAQNESGFPGPHFTEDTTSSGTADWSLVDDVERDADGVNATRAFRLNVSKDDLADSGSSPFTVRVEEFDRSDPSPPSWEMGVWQDGSGSDTVVVEVTKPGGSSEECRTTVTKSYVEIHVTRGFVDDHPCDALRTGPGGTNYRFAAGVGDNYNITYRNGDQARGNYTFVTTNSTFGTTNTLNDGGSRTSPYITDAVYNVSVDLLYDTADLHYDTRIRVAPGESNG